jgi:hypothetical protein
MFSRNKIILIGLAVLLVLGIGIFWYNRKKSDTVVSENIVNQAEIEKMKRVAELNGLNAALDKLRLVDKDLDGLTDAEEEKLGTDPQKSDTDGDGLLDNDEVKIYKTNPLKADTDSDGKKDSYEVRRRQDPLKK